MADRTMGVMVAAAGEEHEVIRGGVSLLLDDVFSSFFRAFSMLRWCTMKHSFPVEG